MQVLKCDRCKTYYDPYRNDETGNFVMIIDRSGGPWAESKTIVECDLCRDCVKKIFAFVTNPNLTTVELKEE